MFVNAKVLYPSREVGPASRLGEGGSGRRSPGRDRGADVAAAESSERSESSGARHSVPLVTN